MHLEIPSGPLSLNPVKFAALRLKRRSLIQRVGRFLDLYVSRVGLDRHSSLWRLRALTMSSREPSLIKLLYRPLLRLLPHHNRPYLLQHPLSSPRTPLSNSPDRRLRSHLCGRTLPSYLTAMPLPRPSIPLLTLP